MLVFHAQAGSAVGLLLPDKFEAGGLDGVEDDLRRLLDGVRRRPNLSRWPRRSPRERRWSRSVAWAFGWRTSSSGLWTAR